MKKTNKILITIILISSLLLSIGYSAINNITLDIEGKAVAIPTTRILVSGTDFNKILKNSESYSTPDTIITKIVFDYWMNGYTENGVVVFEENDWGKGNPIDMDGLGGIKLFKSDDGTKAYILSETDIYANPSCRNMFRYFKSAKEIVFNNFDTSKVNEMYGLFRNCESVKSLDLSSFNTLNVTNMNGMFSDCISLTSLNISSFETSKVNNMGGMFNNVSSLTTLDISNFDTSKVTSMSTMFYNCYNLTSLNLSNFDTSNVTLMDSMFQYAGGITSLDLSNFDTSKVTNMDGMFGQMTSLTSLNISSFDTSNVTSMKYLFVYTYKLTSLDLSSFDTKNVIYAKGVFKDMSGLKTIYVSDKWSTEKVLNTDIDDEDQPFLNCINLVGGAGTTYDSNHTDITYARVDGGPDSETPGYLTLKNTSN